MFLEEGLWKRAVTARGLRDYRLLMDSGLADQLIGGGLLVRHTEETALRGSPPEACQILLPRQLDFISYPYEWCFSQLKDAALATLAIQLRALAHGMSLKDASAFNIQIHRGRPLFIDTLSFEQDDGAPWVAYEQFCRHFLAPLLLMRHVSQDLGRLLAADLNGVTLETASRILGWRSWFSPGALLHVHMHARAIANRAPLTGQRPRGTRHRAKLAVVESLLRAVEGISPPRKETAWSSYETQSGHYPPDALDTKQRFAARVLNSTPRGLVYDVGGNTGQFSRAAAAEGHFCVLYDSDMACIERAYLQARENGERRILPLRLDFSNPPPALGVNLRERQSLFERPRACLVMALALVHHLRLRENIPFSLMAAFFARMGDRLLIEWVGPADPKAAPMLDGRKHPPDYRLETFLGEFSRHFRLVEQQPLPGMDRTLLVMDCLDPAKS